MVTIFVGIAPDHTDDNPATTYDELVNGARELIARSYGKVGDYDHVQTIEDETGLSLCGNLDVPNAVWEEAAESGLTLSGYGVTVSVDAP